MMKASSTPAILSSSSSSRKNLSTPSTGKRDTSLLTEASPETTTTKTTSAAGAKATTAAAAASSSSSHDLSCVSTCLKTIEQRIEQLAHKVAQMEENQSRLLQILLMDKDAIMNPGSTLSTMSDYRTSSASAGDPSSSHHHHHPLMVQKSVMGLPSSSSLPLDCLSFNSIHLFQQSSQQQQGILSASVAPTPTATLTSSASSGCHPFQPGDHTYQPHFQSILTGYQMASKPPDSLPLQSPGHDSLLSSGPFDHSYTL